MEWISVEDKLPEPSIQFDGKNESIACQNRVLIHSQVIGVITGHYWGPNDDPMKGWSVMEVTHWMPLPEPPKTI